MFDTTWHEFEDLNFLEHDTGDKFTIRWPGDSFDEAPARQSDPAPAHAPLPPADVDVPMPPAKAPPFLLSISIVPPVSPPRVVAHQSAPSFVNIGDQDVVNMDVEDSQTSGKELLNHLEKLNTQSKCLLHFLFHCLLFLCFQALASETDVQMSYAVPSGSKCYFTLYICVLLLFHCSLGQYMLKEVCWGSFDCSC